jgi:hypothetical protein
MVAHIGPTTDSGLRRALMWTTAFAAFFLVERVVPSSMNAVVCGTILILGFAMFDLARRRDRQNATLHWIALASTATAYAIAVAFVVAVIDFNADPKVVTSLSEFGSELGRAVMMYVGHCVAFASFTVCGFVAAVRYRLRSGSGVLLLVLNFPCVLFTTYLGVYHSIYGI